MRFFLLCLRKAPKIVEHQVGLLDGLKWTFVTTHDCICILISSFFPFIGMNTAETSMQTYIEDKISFLLKRT